MHEATFDDDLRSDAKAKRHSTTSEAISIGAAMKARRVILTHFSQRYQKIPSSNALDTRSFKLEDAEDVDDTSADMEQPIEESTLPPAMINESSEAPDNKASQVQSEPQPQEDVNESGQLSSTTDSSTRENAENVNPAPGFPLNDMRIGVAFDGMRVKVKDIIHLDKFTPALMELYKEREDEDELKGKKKAFKQDFYDDENDILRAGQLRKVVTTDKKSAEDKAERARKGQVKAAKRREESQKPTVMEKKKEDGKDVASEGTMEGVEATEPVGEKMKAAQ